MADPAPGQQAGAGAGQHGGALLVTGAVQCLWQQEQPAANSNAVKAEPAQR
jgi:hypothetical protein